MPENSPCNIGLLRPAETGLLRYFESQEPNDDIENSIDKYNPFFDEWIDEFRDAILVIADEQKKPIDLEEIQIHSDDGLIGSKRRRNIKEKDALVTLDPQIQTWALISGFMHNKPMRRTIVAFSSHEEFERTFHILGAMKIMTLRPILKKYRDSIIIVLTDCEKVGIPRCFGFYYKNDKGMNDSINGMLNFPYI
ncbi:MAG: hypothetical protein KAS32_14840 [Candidatus Peribacteraceae bacterium]|nr:hypothetical protein [Candidatus Peribacteraceae bacterium]